MNETVYALIDAYKNSKVRNIFNFSLDGRPYRLFLFNDIPRIGLDLLQSQGNSFLCNVYIQDHSIHHVIHIHNL